MYELDQKLSRYLSFPHGYFVEAGAFDGIRGSNTKFLELYRGWRGVLVEPLPKEFQKLGRYRSSKTAKFQKALVSFGFTETTGTILSAGMMTIMPLGSTGVSDAVDHARSGMSFLGGGPVEKLEVQTATLNELLQECRAQKSLTS